MKSANPIPARSMRMRLGTRASRMVRRSKACIWIPVTIFMGWLKQTLRRVRSSGEHSRRSAEECLHLTHGLIKADEDSSSNNTVADIVFHDLRDVGQALDILIIQPMAGVDPYSQLVGKLGGLGDGFEFRICLFRALGIGISTCMQLYKISGDLMRCFDLAEVRLHEQTDGNAAVVHHGDDLLHAFLMGQH